MAKRILIVDDEDHIRRVMRMTMEAAGHGADEAGDGYRGLELFGDGSAWDAVLLDQKMPGMDGLETLRRMKQRDPSARVIMVTAYASVELAVDAMKLGATDFVRKPMTPETLRNAVTAALAKPRTAVAVAPEPVAGQAPALHAPPISRLTLNGFRLWQAPGARGMVRPGERGRVFVVQHPDGKEQEVRVEFDPGAVTHLERAARQDLPADSAFWGALAERLLNSALWNEGRVPAGGTFVVGVARLDAESVQLASRWGRS